MAYIPDEAIDRMTELSAGAWRLYCFLARCRNQKTGKCFPSVKTTAAALGAHDKYVYQLRKELAGKKWAQFTGDVASLFVGFISKKNLTSGDENKGDVGSKNKTPQESPQNSKMVRKILLNGQKNLTTAPENQSAGVRKILPDSQKILTKSQKILTTHHYHEPANKPAKEPANNPTGSDVISERKRKPVVECEKFQSLHLEFRKVPYTYSQHDFVHLAKLKKSLAAQNWEFTLEKWETAARNYFLSEISRFTLADLANRFSTFFVTRIDRYNRPIADTSPADCPATEEELRAIMVRQHCTREGAVQIARTRERSQWLAVH